MDKYKYYEMLGRLDWLVSAARRYYEVLDGLAGREYIETNREIANQYGHELKQYIKELSSR